MWNLKKICCAFMLFMLAALSGGPGQPSVGAQRQAKCQPITQIKLSRGISSRLLPAAEKNRLLAAEVRKCGVSFTLTPDFEQELCDEGANDEVIAAIRANGPRVAAPPPTHSVYMIYMATYMSGV